MRRGYRLDNFAVVSVQERRAAVAHAKQAVLPDLLLLRLVGRVQHLVVWLVSVVGECV